MFTKLFLSNTRNKDAPIIKLWMFYRGWVWHGSMLGVNVRIQREDGAECDMTCRLSKQYLFDLKGSYLKKKAVSFRNVAVKSWRSYHTIVATSRRSSLNWAIVYFMINTWWWTMVMDDDGGWWIMIMMVMMDDAVWCWWWWWIMIEDDDDDWL